MTLHEMMLGNMPSKQTASIMQLGAQNTQKSGGRNESKQFADILGGRMSGTARQEGLNRSNTGHSSEAGNAETVAESRNRQSRYLTFREANAKNAKAAPGKVQEHKMAESTPDDDHIINGEDKSKNAHSANNAPHNMLQLLAQVMGVDTGELQKLLKEAGITSEAFNNMKNADENVSKLSQLLGLSSEQEEALMKMLQLAGEVTEASTKAQPELDTTEVTAREQVKANGDGKSSPMNGAGAADSQEAISSEAADETAAADMKRQIREKLDELGERLVKDRSSVESEWRRFLQQSSDRLGKILNVQDENSAAVGNKLVEQLEVQAAGAEADGQDSKEPGRETNAKSENGTAALQSAPLAEEAQTQPAFAVIQPGKVSGAASVEKTDLKMPVTQKEIISQVIEKAKVTLTPDKSEMVMDLKPDSLGKISLKVITENGMVMAKFIAENQQVKQVLESNMQLLKDSLEKQGMSVQGFSVSVRQDSSRSSESWSQTETGRNRGLTGNDYRTAGLEGDLTGAVAAAAVRNPYSWGGSTINLTA